MSAYYILLLIIFGDYGVAETTQIDHLFTTKEDCIIAGKQWKSDVVKGKGGVPVFSCLKVKGPAV